MKVTIWTDDKEFSTTFESTGSGAADLNQAAREFGYVDYADMAQSLGWNEDEGLNIEWEAQQEDA